MDSQRLARGLPTNGSEVDLIASATPVPPLTLPAVNSGKDKIRMNLKVVGEESRGTAGAMARKVMVVDDDPEQVAEVVEYLVDRGIPATGESNPETAVARVEAERPALVMIDVNMPGIDGLRMTQVVRGLNYGGVILLVSGDLDAVYRANQVGPDVFAVLSKPIPLQALERYARAVLARGVI